MNLLCPNCQKMLTVPEQYAGQLMKCPLCNGTFTVPALPSAPTAPPPTAPPPPTGPDVFNFKEPLPPAPPTSAPPSMTVPASQPSAPSAPPPPPPPPLPPGEYTRKASIWFSPKVLQFVPPVVLFLVFVLTFFPWVGVYPGGFAYSTESAWGVIGGNISDDPNLAKEIFRFTTDKDLEEQNKDMKDKIKDNRPGWGLLMLFFLLSFLFVFAVTIAVSVVGVLPMKMPAAVAPFLVWRWGVAFLLNLFLFFLLVLQLLAGFPLETSVKAWAESRANREEKANRADKSSSDADKRNTVQETNYKTLVGMYSNMVERTIWPTIAIWLLALVVVCTLILFWLSQRQRFNKPLPELTLRW